MVLNIIVNIKLDQISHTHKETFGWIFLLLLFSEPKSTNKTLGIFVFYNVCTIYIMYHISSHSQTNI